MASAAEGRTRVTGGCACGEIRFGFYEPTTFSAACHCRSCQYTSGGGPAYVVGANREQFRVFKGHPAEYVTLSESGHLITRAFCANCGTHLYAVSDLSPEVCVVKVGALDDPSTFKPRAQIWTREAQPWHKKYWLALRFRRNPPFTAAARNSQSALSRR